MPHPPLRKGIREAGKERVLIYLEERGGQRKSRPIWAAKQERELASHQAERISQGPKSTNGGVIRRWRDLYQIDIRS
jgi:hypothetical protein